MKNLILIFSLLLLAACGGGGGSGGAVSDPTTPIDSTPHVYTMVAYAGAADELGPFYEATIRGSCNVGALDERGLSADLSLRTPANAGGVGCNNARNINLVITNVGDYALMFSVTIDGVLLGTNWLQPGEAYAFRRGF